jgi:SAM-dependent methyltransferase
MNREENDVRIRKHYRDQAEKEGDSALSTMGERVVRQKELDLISSFISAVTRSGRRQKVCRVLDVGCGNGYTLQKLVETFDDIEFSGLEMTPELLQIAEARQLERCQLRDL